MAEIERGTRARLRAGEQNKAAEIWKFFSKYDINGLID